MLSPLIRRSAIVVLATLLLLAHRTSPPALSTFAAQIAALSEPEGYFDTDNLISNERSYLEILPELRRRGVRGGAYIGVGPDQSFSYIAEVRPDIAFIIDVRRDNLLLHLLFKSLFALSRTRVEYLSLLLGRPVPSSLSSWQNMAIEQLVAHADSPPLRAKSIDALRTRVDAEIRKSGVPLSNKDFATIDRFHRRFIDSGLDLRFQTIGRPPQTYYPTYRDLVLERDSDGRGCYLSSEEAFQFVKSLQARDLVIPVVGDLSGPSALAGIGRFVERRGKTVSVLYASNVEFYLFRNGTFPRFVQNLARVPHTDHSVVIRSVFNRYSLPGWRSNSASVSLVQAMKELLDGFDHGRYRRYDELVGR